MTTVFRSWPAPARRPDRRFVSLAALVAALFFVLPQAAAAQDPTFRSVSLDDAIRIAIERNPGLDQARTNVEGADYNKLATVGGFLPDLSMRYGYSNSSTGRLDPTGQGIVSTSYTVQLSASYDLFTGFRRFADMKTANLGVQEQNARLRQTQYETIRLVKQAYFNAVAARALVTVEQDRVARLEDQLNFVEQQLELGRATRSDLLRSQVDLNAAKLNLLNAENGTRTTAFRLTEVIGAEQSVAPEPSATLEAPPFPYDRDQLIDIAVVSAPSVVTAIVATDAAESSVSSARSAYLPSLAFSGGYAWANQEFPPSNRSWSLSVSGSYPLFNGFTRENNVYQAQVRADNARSQERSARLALRADLEAAYSTMQSANAGIDLAEENVELSGESLRVEQERYRLGLSTILDLQLAQITLSQAEVDLIQRRFDFLLAVALIESLLGQDLIDR